MLVPEDIFPLQPLDAPLCLLSGFNDHHLKKNLRTGGAQRRRRDEPHASKKPHGDTLIATRTDKSALVRVWGVLSMGEVLTNGTECDRLCKRVCYYFNCAENSGH